MTIPNQTLKKWIALKEDGDIALIAKEINKSEPTVYNIFSSGKASVNDATKINAFFKRRKKQVDAITIDDNN